MRVTLSIIAATATATLLAACQPPAAAPPAVDTAKIASDLKAGEVQWVSDLAAKDAAKDAGHYDDNATLMAPGQAPVKGKAAIQQTMGEQFKDPNFSLTFTADDVFVNAAGDLGYTQGHFTETDTNPVTHARETSTGAYLTVYRKEADGSWKAVEDIATPGAPPPAG
jgi:ketosteroid isomerase-like protein